ncbi:hypothetical protein H5410_053988 [Solanum commersonii]|uniref:Uncharacterized protein n=1 Tax=Solanum commersonii TaxID=4109 RepID=A0A9J5X4Z4_SOLCO|nr:hypothetical protein H5410_053988 [Solanum commersonii]
MYWILNNLVWNRVDPIVEMGLGQPDSFVEEGEPQSYTIPLRFHSEKSSFRKNQIQELSPEIRRN